MGGSLGEDGGHHDIAGAEHGGALTAAEIDAGSDESRSLKQDVATLDGDLGAERLKALEVKVDGAVADDAAAGAGDLGHLLAAEEGTQHADGGSHLADDLVGGLGPDLLGADLDDAAGPLHLGAELAEDGEHVMDVAQVGDAVDDAFLLGEEGGREDREGGVLGTSDADIAFEAAASVNEYLIHFPVCSIL